MITSRKIFVQFQKEGIHKYPDAPEEVSFLRHPHRHMFWFKVEIDVEHNERDLEFIMVKRELENLYGNNTLQMDSRSCETLAEELINYIITRWPNRNVMVQVSEDGESGAILKYDWFKDVADVPVERYNTFG